MPGQYVLSLASVPCFYFLRHTMIWLTRVMGTELYGLVELFYVTARLLQCFKAVRKPDDGVEVKSTGAGVLLPPHGATLQLQVAK